MLSQLSRWPTVVILSLAASDTKWDSRRLTGYVAPPGPDWLRELIGIVYFVDVVFVNLQGSEIEDVVPLHKLPDLQRLWLTSTDVSDLKPLRKLTQLQWLWVDHTQVDDLSPLLELKSVFIFLEEESQVTVPEELKDRVLCWSP